MQMYFFHFSLTLLLGIIGNLLILVAILGYKKMKSPTNVFLASLALADLLLCLICIPVKVRNLYMNNLQKKWINISWCTSLKKPWELISFRIVVQGLTIAHKNELLEEKLFFCCVHRKKSDLFYASKSCFSQSKVLCMCSLKTNAVF